MEFSRQGCWSGLSFPPPEYLPSPGMETVSYVAYTGRQILYRYAAWEAPKELNQDSNSQTHLLMLLSLPQ